MMQRSTQHPAYCFRDRQIKFVLVAFFKQIAVFKILDPLHLEIALLFQVVDNLELGLYSPPGSSGRILREKSIIMPIFENL